MFEDYMKELYDIDIDRLGFGVVKKLIWPEVVPKGLYCPGNRYVSEEREIHLKRYLCIDGKASRAAADKKNKENMPYLGGIYDPDTQVYLSLVDIANSKEEGEATKLREEIQKMELEGTIITADDLHTSKETMQAICNSGGEFCIRLKEGSHKEVYSTVMETLNSTDPEKCQHRVFEECSKTKRVEYDLYTTFDTKAALSYYSPYIN